MGFFYIGKKIEQTTLAGVSLDFLHKHGCAVCPLNHQAANLNPQMKPYGTKTPIIYILGESPGETEDKRGRPFVGKAGRILHARIPDHWQDHLRWNNCVRTRPPNNRTPTPTELECCRPSIEQDLMATKPRAIFGFGGVPLHWAIKQSGILKWNGRRIPIRVGDHACWYFAMMHPSFIAHQRRFEPRNEQEYGCEEEFAFALDLERAFDIVDDLPDPEPYTREMALEGLEIITGHGGWDDVDRVQNFLDDAAREPFVGFDYETRRLRPFHDDAKLLSVAIAMRDHSMAIALGHDDAGWTDAQLDEIEWLLADFIYNAPCRKIAHHLPFELEWTGVYFGREAIRAGEWEDTESQAYILDERQGALSLEFLCMQRFGIDIKAINNTDRNNLDKTPLDTVLEYNALDAKFHRLLWIEQDRELKRQQLELVYERQLRRVPTMALTQLQGIPVNQDNVVRHYRHWKRKRIATETKIQGLPEAAQFQRLKGHPFRPAAWQDVLFAMNKILKGRIIEKTDEKELAKIKHPLAKLTIDWRHENKMLSTYVLPSMDAASADIVNEMFDDEEAKPSDVLFLDGLHPSINLCSTRTWRTSASEPNVQNWPKHENKELRDQIEPGGTRLVVSFDFGQIQARNVAMESRDARLVQAFWDWYDIHADWAERITRRYPRWLNGKSLLDKDVFKKFRQFAKNEFVFPSFFGAQPKKLSTALGIPEHVTEQLHEEFWNEFPDIYGWQEGLKTKYYETGYVTGLSGFRRRAPIAINELINAPIQADEALIVTTAMSALSEKDDERLQAYMEIHDDLIFIWEKHEIDKLAPIVIGEMLKLRWDWLNVPLVAEMSVGKNWSEMKEVGVFESLTSGGFMEIKK